MYDMKDIQKEYYNRIIKDIKVVFMKYFDSEDYFDQLVVASNVNKHIKIFSKAKKDLSTERFKDFIDELIEYDMIKHYVYSQVLNYDCSNCFFGYSPLLDFIMKAEDFTISNAIIKKYKTYFSDFLSFEKFDICSKRFESFRYLSKRVNWQKLIKDSYKNGNFGNEVSTTIIKDSLQDMFQKNPASRYYDTLDLETFFLIVIHDMLENVTIIDRIANDDFKVSQEIIDFIREYILFQEDNQLLRHKSLHMIKLKDFKINKNIEKYSSNLEKFYQFLRNKVSPESLLLLSLK